MTKKKVSKKPIDDKPLAKPYELALLIGSGIAIGYAACMMIHVVL